MEDRRTMSVTLEAREKRQLLVESGTVVLVTSGDVTVGQSVDWLNGEAVRVVQRLVGEDVWVVDMAGWLDIVASRAAQLVVIPPDRVSFWQQVGCRLEAWFRISRGSGRKVG